MNAGSAEAEEDVAERMCIVTREVMDEAQLIRFVRGPEGEVVPDLARKLPGRGVWVALSRARVAEAVKRKAFRRGLRRGHGWNRSARLVADLLRKAALAYLSLAKKAARRWRATPRSRKCWPGQGADPDPCGRGCRDGRRKLDSAGRPGTSKRSDLFHRE